MTTLLKYTRAQLKAEIDKRLAKVASMTDDDDFDTYSKEALSKLDEAMYSPRNLVLESDRSSMVDVTELHIDAINNVYYAPSTTMNLFFEDLGFLPFVSQNTSLSCLESVVSYLQLQSVINMMQRKMTLTNDWELYPIDANGRQMLQLNNKGLCWIEYLPHIDAEADEWQLYSYEYSFLVKYTFALIMRANCEYQASANGLGVGKEIGTTLTYWDTRVGKELEEFTKHQSLAYLQ